MRLVTLVLIALLVLIQYPLWWGRGGWLRVRDQQQQLQTQLQKNADDKARNDRMAGEVQDLQDGTAVVEERARHEMGMVKDGEVFVQFVSPNQPAPARAVASVAQQGTGATSGPVSEVPNPVPFSEEKKKRHAPHGHAAEQGAAH